MKETDILKRKCMDWGKCIIAFGNPCKVYREINEHDEEYYFKDRRFDEQPE